MTTHFIRQFLETLYPDPVTEAGGRLVLWTRKHQARKSRSYWVENLDRAVELAIAAMSRRRPTRSSITR